MSFRITLAVALFVMAAFQPFDSVFAIDKDQLINPGLQQGVADSADTSESDVMDGIFSGSQASTGALMSFIGFAVIIAALAVVVWYLFKRGLIRKPFVKGEGKLKIAETRMLGNRQFISVVEYEDQKILIGVGPGKIDYLTTLRSYGSGEFPSVEGAEPIDLREMGGKA